MGDRLAMNNAIADVPDINLESGICALPMAVSRNVYWHFVNMDRGKPTGQAHLEQLIGFEPNWEKVYSIPRESTFDVRFREFSVQNST